MTRKLYDQCPYCSSQDLVSIVYGYPTKETLERANHNKIRLGGCVVSDISPVFQCRNCKKDIGSRSEYIAYHHLINDLAEMDMNKSETEKFLFDLIADQKEPDSRRKVAVKLLENERLLLELRLIASDQVQPTIKTRLRQIIPQE